MDNLIRYITQTAMSLKIKVAGCASDASGMFDNLRKILPAVRSSVPARMATIRRVDWERA